MDRRSFLGTLLGAVGAAVVDPEFPLWVPGQKKIFIPTSPKVYVPEGIIAPGADKLIASPSEWGVVLHEVFSDGQNAGWQIVRYVRYNSISAFANRLPPIEQEIIYRAKEVLHGKAR